MLVNVDLIYDNQPKRRITVQIPDGKKGRGFLGAIAKAVVKQEADDKDWTRWHLISVQ